MEDGVNATPQTLLPTQHLPQVIHRRGTSASVTTLLRWKVPAVVESSGLLEDAVRLCERMAAQVEERGQVGAVGKAHNKGWVLAMEALLRIDGRTVEQVTKVLDWLAKGTDDVSDFWRGNVLSPNKLRVRWGQMEIQYQRLRRRQVGGRTSGLAEATGADRIIQGVLERDRAARAAALGPAR